MELTNQTATNQDKKKKSPGTKRNTEQSPTNQEKSPSGTRDKEKSGSGTRDQKKTTVSRLGEKLIQTCNKKICINIIILGGVILHRYTKRFLKPIIKGDVVLLLNFPNYQIFADSCKNGFIKLSY